MNGKLSKKSKISCLGIIFVLILSVISLSLVQGEKPADPGTPPSGLLSEIYEALDNLEVDLINLQNGLGELGNVMENQDINLQNQIDTVWTEMGLHVEGFNVAIINLQSEVQSLHDEINEVRGDIDILFNSIGNLQNQINDRPTFAQHNADVDGLLNHVNTVDNSLQNQIDGLNTRIPQLSIISIPATEPRKYCR